MLVILQADYLPGDADGIEQTLYETLAVAGGDVAVAVVAAHLHQHYAVGVGFDPILKDTDETHGTLEAEVVAEARVGKLDGGLGGQEDAG